jgi:hypothetical protein
MIETTNANNDTSAYLYVLIEPKCLKNVSLPILSPFNMAIKYGAVISVASATVMVDSLHINIITRHTNVEIIMPFLLSIRIVITSAAFTETPLRQDKIQFGLK